MAARAKRVAQLARGATPVDLAEATTAVQIAATRAGHGVARCGYSLECYRCGASCMVNDVDGKPVTMGTLHTKGCPK